MSVRVCAHAYACMCLTHVDRCPQRSGKDFGSPGAGVIGSCELSGMGPGNSGTLVEQVLLLITQPSLQPLYDTSSKKISAEPGLSTPSRLGERLVEFSEVG